MSDTVTKAEHKILERMFTGEINSTIEHSKVPYCYQSKAKICTAMAEKGLIEMDRIALGGRFPVTIKGWILTELGRLTYCIDC